MALVDIECRPLQQTRRLGVWIGADPAPAVPEAIREFLSAFRFCE